MREVQRKPLPVFTVFQVSTAQNNISKQHILKQHVLYFYSHLGVVYSATLQIPKSQLSSHFLGLPAASNTVDFALVFEAFSSLYLHDIPLFWFFFHVSGHSLSASLRTFLALPVFFSVVLGFLPVFLSIPLSEQSHLVPLFLTLQSVSLVQLPVLDTRQTHMSLPIGCLYFNLLSNLLIFNS